jgi:hypothetical protein
MKPKIKFSIKDFPIGSYLYFFRVVQIQVNPKIRKSGEKKFFKDYAYSKMKVTHYCGNLVGVEGDDSNEGFDCTEFRIHGGFFVIPEWAFLGLKGKDFNHHNLDYKQKLTVLLNEGTGNF